MILNVSFLQCRISILFIVVVLSSCKFLGVGSIPLEELKSKYSNSESEFITIDHVNLHYRDEGKGPVIILLHGVCSSLHTWDDWTAILKDRYRVIRLDLPGHGLTEIGEEDSVLKTEGMILLLEEFRKRLKIEKFYLVGNSLGGFVSWRYALEYPSRVEKLVLIDSVGYPQPLPELVAVGSHPLIQPLMKVSTPRFVVSRGVSQAYGDPTRLKDEVEERYVELSMKKGNRSAIVKIFKEQRESFQNEEMGKRIPEIRTPALVMWGTEDHWLSYEYFPNWKRDLPNAKFVVYEGAGHIPMEEIPERSAKDLDLFLSKKE
ncbi:alpha/beta hydrolase [Leptospira sp. 201903070]|uniref:Alpha/beta hydrolase n=1 Tax=Leptospira ainlahdjerensis TaxID=2810033 RepID=A0ABS2U7A2_9LEPT|nr:alpha/beta hydrolase [Leptospira ainlahdjerensis]MBM9576246.1 alpha/beta hydrolase [Leptospira ainlahdjerensis]